MTAIFMAAFAPLKTPRPDRATAAWAGEASEPSPPLRAHEGARWCSLRVTGSARGAVAIDVPRTIWLAGSPIFPAEPPAPRLGTRGAGTTQKEGK